MADGSLIPSAIPASDDLTVWPIADLRRAFQAGHFTPVDLVRAQIERIQAHNSTLNALVGLETDAALEAAEAAGWRYRNGTARPLEGFTVAIKEAHAFAGRASTAGSLTHDGQPDVVSAPIVDRLLRAGAMPLGRSTTPEFSMASTTASPRFGVARNPWNPAFSPGGSSGGAAAAVAAGLVTLADGSDHGGSIRTPAACCGVVGYKAPWGRVPVPPEQASDPCQHYGLICRSLPDLLMAQDLVADPGGRIAGPIRLQDLAPADQPIRVAVTTDYGLFSPDEAITASLQRAACTIEEAGHQVVQAGIVVPRAALVAYENYCLVLACRALGPKVAQSDVPVADYVRLYLERAAHAPEDPMPAFEAACHAVRAALARVFDQADVLLSPVTGTIGVAPDFSIANPTLRPGGPSVFWEEEWQMTWPFNLASEVPVLALPAGMDHATGLPFGIQLAGPAGDEARLLRSALALAPILTA